MCLHMFMYYPRMSNFYMCSTIIPPAAWTSVVNSSVLVLALRYECSHHNLYLSCRNTSDYMALQNWLLQLQWTPELVADWQRFYDTAPRLVGSGRSGDHSLEMLSSLPNYEDVRTIPCRRAMPVVNMTSTRRPRVTTTATTPDALSTESPQLSNETMIPSTEPLQMSTTAILPTSTTTQAPIMTMIPSTEPPQMSSTIIIPATTATQAPIMTMIPSTEPPQMSSTIIIPATTATQAPIMTMNSSTEPLRISSTIMITRTTDPQVLSTTLIPSTEPLRISSTTMIPSTAAPQLPSTTMPSSTALLEKASSKASLSTSATPTTIGTSTKVSTSVGTTPANAGAQQFSRKLLTIISFLIILFLQ